MRRSSYGLATIGACVVAIVAAGISGSPATATTGLPLQPYLKSTLAAITSTTTTTVLVHGTSISAAGAAVALSGMKLVTTFNKIGVAVARGTADQIRTAARQPGVTYVEGNQPIEMFLDTSNRATRGSEARATLAGANGSALDGTGVSVAVIDSGIDPRTRSSVRRAAARPSYGI